MEGCCGGGLGFGGGGWRGGAGLGLVEEGGGLMRRAGLVGEEG